MDSNTLSTSLSTPLSIVLKQTKNREFFENHLSKVNEDNRKWIVYQTCGLLMQDPKNLKEIAKNVKHGKVGWESPIYTEQKEKRNEFDSYLERPFEVSEGISQCQKCGSKKTYSIQKQSRSLDEATSTFSRCVQCNNTWSYSG